MVEGIGTGTVIALAWAFVLLLLSSPWARDHVRGGALSAVTSLTGSVAALVAFDRCEDLSNAHGRWVGYGSVLGASLALLVLVGLTVRRLTFFRAWRLYGIPVGRVPAPKSRRAPRSQRAWR